MTTSYAAVDRDFMQLAIEASAAALQAGNMPFGAALVRDGSLLAVAQNEQVSAKDPMAHAEVVLVRAVNAAHGREALRGSTVYASGEPCAMCSGALFWAGVSRVVFAATQQDIVTALGGATLPIRTAEVLANSAPAVQVEGECERSAAVGVLQLFARRAGVAS